MTDTTNTPPMHARSSRGVGMALSVLFLICLGLNFWAGGIGFSDPISSHHGFRKAQTAISAYYTIKDGFKLDYETPVMGAPWSIPMEFPLYQWAVAAWTMLTGMPLDMAGRLVSWFFFYCCLPVIFLLGRSLGLSKSQSLLPLCLILLSPLYIYWSRTFMIESMALFFSLSFLLCFIRYRTESKRWLLALAVVCGILAGLVKITTLFISSVPVIMLMGADTWRALRDPNRGKALARTALTYALALGIPVIIAVIWTRYADSVKAQNPMAGLIISSNLTKWNFGTFGFRFSHKCWAGYTQFMRETQIGPLAGLVVLAPLLLKTPFRRWGLLSLCAYLAGPLVFSNLYYVHDYYSYANTVFLLLAMACGLLALQSLRWGGAASVALLVLLGCSFGYGYFKGYLPDQAFATPIPPQCTFIRQVTDPDDVVFLNDLTWDSYGPYYMQRRALMNYDKWPLSNPKLQKAIDLTGIESITAASIKNPSQELLELFQLVPVPIFADIYLRGDLYARAYQRLFDVDLNASGPASLLHVTYQDNTFGLSVRPGGSFALNVPKNAVRFSAKLFAPSQQQLPPPRV